MIIANDLSISHIEKKLEARIFAGSMFDSENIGGFTSFYNALLK